LPADDFITNTSRFGISICPALNNLNSMLMLSFSDSFANGADSWIEHILNSLSLEEKKEIDLIFFGLYHGVIPENSFPDFDSYIEFLETCDPLHLQSKILKAYVEKHNKNNGKYSDYAYSEIRDEVLKSSENYLSFLSEGFNDTDFNIETEKEAYKLIIEPEKMQKRITSLIIDLWDKYFEQNWEDTKTELQSFCDSFNFQILNQLPRERIITYMTGHDLPKKKLDYLLNCGSKISFVPSLHLKGNYTKILSDDRLCIFFDPSAYKYRKLNEQLGNIDELSLKLGVLADSNRLKILKYIAEQKETCSKDIMSDLNFSQSAVSRHLQQLSMAGVLSERRQYSAKYYKVRSEYLQNILSSVSAFLSSPIE